MPLLREGVSIGCIQIRRAEVEPFTDKQAKLLQTFADQAVIAIENVRLFTELQEKNKALTAAHAQVTEALEQRTATSEILRVIASSPIDLRPVLDAVAERAARLCSAADVKIHLVEGDTLRLAAQLGAIPSAETRPIIPTHHIGSAVLERRTIHVLVPEVSTAAWWQDLGEEPAWDRRNVHVHDPSASRGLDATLPLVQIDSATVMRDCSVRITSFDTGQCVAPCASSRSSLSAGP